MRASLRALAPGATSAPIRTAAGYVVVKLERATPPVHLSFVEARPSIMARLLETARREALEAFMRRLRVRAVIVWKDAALGRAYEQHLASTPARRP